MFKSYFAHVITPTQIDSWFANIVLFIPRFVGGFVLTVDFGASKFGMPWSPSDKDLSLFEVVHWFPQDVAAYGGPKKSVSFNMPRCFKSRRSAAIGLSTLLIRDECPRSR